MVNEESKSKEKQDKIKVKKPVPTWDQIQDKVYDSIEFYATRFIIISVIGVVIGMIGLIYGILNIVFLGTTFTDIFVALSVFIGVGAIVISLVLLIWGIFWRGKVEKRTII